MTLLLTVVENYPCRQAADKLHKCRTNGYVIGNCTVGNGSLSERERKRCDKLLWKISSKNCSAYECELIEPDKPGNTSNIS